MFAGSNCSDRDFLRSLLEKAPQNREWRRIYTQQALVPDVPSPLIKKDTCHSIWPIKLDVALPRCLRSEMGDFNADFSFDVGDDVTAAQAPWEFGSEEAGVDAALLSSTGAACHFA